MSPSYWDVLSIHYKSEPMLIAWDIENLVAQGFIASFQKLIATHHF